MQVMSEVKSFLQMMDEVYGIFGLDYTMALSTRPEGYLGEQDVLLCVTMCCKTCGRCWSTRSSSGRTVL
jgi:threonyl-tRNA synthetase